MEVTIYEKTVNGKTFYTASAEGVSDSISDVRELAMYGAWLNIMLKSGWYMAHRGEDLAAVEEFKNERFIKI